MPVNVLIGTNNPAKFNDAVDMAAEYPDLKLYKPADLGIQGVPEETGSTYTENAHIKRDFYMQALKGSGQTDYYVLADDGGLEIDALGGEPGIHSRRWKDGVTEMTDQEAIDYALERLKDVPADNRTAAFAGIVALGHPGNDVTLDVPYRLEGMILKEPDYRELAPGYPFRALFYLPQYGMMLSRIAHMPKEERPDGFLSHRELGLRTAYAKILELSASELTA